MLSIKTVTSKENLTALIDGMRGRDLVPLDILDSIRQIMRDVRNGGDEELLRYTAKFDGMHLSARELVVSREEMEAAANRLPQEQLNAMIAARDNIDRFHQKQGYTPFNLRDVSGSQVGMKVLPLESCGIYVPGGRAAYPSTLLMCAVPARVAGVDRIAVVSPIRRGSLGWDATLTAAYLAGVTSVYPVGGAQAIAALVYGTETIPRVDKIVGPGNLYVTAAKLVAYGQVGIDMAAGPSEVLVIADETADPDHIAIDLISQAEHDVAASVYLVSTSLSLIERVNDHIEAWLPKLEREEIAKASITENGYAFLVPSLDVATQLTNAIAPEHLQIITENPQGLFRDIRFAGTCFLGPHTPEAVGDYLVGPNHVLPTHGSARFFNSLGTYDFQRRINYIELTQEGFEAVASHTAAFADLEGLGAHAESVRTRQRQQQRQDSNEPA